MQAGSESWCRREKRFRIDSAVGWYLREVLVVRVYRMAVEQSGDAVTVKAARRRRRVRLCRSKGGEQKKEAGEMASAQSHGFL